HRAHACRRPIANPSRKGRILSRRERARAGTPGDPDPSHTTSDVGLPARRASARSLGFLYVDAFVERVAVALEVSCRLPPCRVGGVRPAKTLRAMRSGLLERQHSCQALRVVVVSENLWRPRKVIFRWT